MKKCRLFAFCAFLVSTTAMAANGIGHHGNTGCDPSWVICLQSFSSKGTNANVDSVVVQNIRAQIPRSSADQMVIDVRTGDVSIRHAGQSLVIGRVAEPVGDDASTAFSREAMSLSEDLNATIASEPGKNITRCNPTAYGAIYQNYTYRTMDRKLTITLSGRAVGEFDSTEVIEPAISVHNTIIPCSK